MPVVKKEYLSDFKFSDIMQALLLQAEYVQESPKTEIASKALKPILNDALYKIVHKGVSPQEALNETQQAINELSG